MFKLFENKKSTLKKDCRYVQGGKSVIEGEKIKWWERTTYIKNLSTDIEFNISKQTEFRPDLVSYLIYDTAKYDWLVLQYNNIIDLTEEFISGKTIMLPSRQRVLLDLTSKPISYK